MKYEPGLLVADRYRLEEIIATGGMGQVWRATDETLERPVAVKVLRPDTAGEEGFVERFRAEARHSAGLQHPNIATVHDFGEGAHSAYLVMELIEGRPLSAIIKDRAPLPPEEVTEILYQAAMALQAAHDAGVVHRDVKPANIVVDDEGYARLTDFGISRALAGAQLTQTGEVLGTPHYLAPEQAQGRPAGPASDIYALAVVGYEMITGNRPFAGDSMITTALAHVSQPAPQLPADIPDPLRTTVMAGLAKDPAQRPERAAAFAEALRLPPGTVPEHLAAGAASAVAPVVAGGALLTPDPAGQTAFMPLQPSTPPIPATVTSKRGESLRRWTAPIAALVAAIVLVVVMVVTSSGEDAAQAPQRSVPPAAASASTASATTASASTASASIAAPSEAAPSTVAAAVSVPATDTASAGPAETTLPEAAAPAVKAPAKGKSSGQGNPGKGGNGSDGNDGGRRK